MIRSNKFVPAAIFSALLSLTAATTVSAQQPGITDAEIKFGNIMPYSGPASALSVTGKAFAAYFDLINEKGGVLGKYKIVQVDGERVEAALHLADDGVDAPRTAGRAVVRGRGDPRRIGLRRL